MRALRASSLTLILALPLASCSLMGLDDFGGSGCTSDPDCVNAESELRPSASACGSAFCDEAGLCQWREGKEICNGQDDDCDGLIDEDLTLPVPASMPVSDVPVAVAYASLAEPEQTFVAVATMGVGQGYTLLPNPKPAGDLRYESEPEPNGIFSELALAADSAHLVVASINTHGAAKGQLRVGLSQSQDAPFSVRLDKPPDNPSEEPSNIPFGVVCTGDAGATRPALASLGTAAKGEGALLLWLAAPANAAEHGDSIPVEALGLEIPTQGSAWLSGTDRGKPCDLGDTTSLSAPAVLALKSRSGRGKYLVAFPAEQDERLGVRLFTVQSDGASLSLSGAQSDGFLDGGPAQQVSLALGSSADAEAGVAWHSGTGSEAQLHFAVVSLSEPRFPQRTALSIPSPNARFAPQMLHQNTGFAQGEHTGGWFLSWVEATGEQSQTLNLARVRDATGQILNQTPLRSGIHAQPLLYPSSNDGVASPTFALIDPSVRSDPETFVNWCQ